MGSRPQSSFTESRIEFDNNHKPHNSVIDVAEREYRSRFQSNYRDEVPYAGTTVDVPSHRSSFKTSSHFDDITVDAPRNLPKYKESTRVTATTVDVPAPRSSFHKDIKITEETVDAPRYAPTPKTSKMGYYDEDGKLPTLFPPSRRKTTTSMYTKSCTHHRTNPRPLPLSPPGTPQAC